MKRLKTVLSACTLLAGLLLTGCASLAGNTASFEKTTHNSLPPEQDRQAILAMAGEYRVHFDFAENLALAPDYELHKPHRTGGNELVIVLEDSPTRIVLQHLLVSDRGHVTKHWRQDWEWQQTDFWQFDGHYTWSKRSVTPEQVRGKWVQTVWQVDDSPRYAGIGAWDHRFGISRWTSDETRRPLPRREHTIRDDYDVMLGINRHTITPDGWSHEQNNYKLRLASADKGVSEQVLAHENGNNTYTRISDFDFSPARSYWEKTALYWQAVRDVWAEKLAAHEKLQLPWPQTEDDPVHYMIVLVQANEIGKHGDSYQSRRDLFSRALDDLLRVDDAVVSP